MALLASASKAPRIFRSAIKAIGFGMQKGTSAASATGGTVTQQTNRTTGVTLNKLCGTITTSTAALAPENGADFVVTNNKVGANDVVIVSMKSGATQSATSVEVAAVAEGSFTLRVINGLVAGGTNETAAIAINFVVIKSVVS